MPKIMQYQLEYGLKMNVYEFVTISYALKRK